MLIAIVEIIDQFENISSIDLVENSQIAMQDFEKNIPQNDFSKTLVKFYKVEDWNYEYQFLKELFSHYTYGYTAIYEWMDEHEDNLIIQPL